MTKKFVIVTVQPIIRKYYVEVDNPTWAHDSIVMNELQDYSQFFGSEDIVSTQKVKQWPQPEPQESVNAAVMQFNNETDQWDTQAIWDITK